MEKIKGVNLGGWLVLEKWMTPNLFEGTKADDEYYLAHDLNSEEYYSRIKTHRSEFITEADFLYLSSVGINTVRIPIPYFIFDDRPPFIGCVEELDKAFSWANEYNLKILLDLHTAPLSQNGFDNGGLSGVCKWAKTPKEVEFVLSVLERLSKRYSSNPALWGIEILNEPITQKQWDSMNPLERYPARDKSLAKGSAPIEFSFLFDFYKKAYTMLRANLTDDIKIVFHDGFELHMWENFFKTNKFTNVMLDTHQYIMFAELEGVEQTLDSYTNYIKDLGHQLKQVQKYVPVFVGEWSLFNSYATGTDTKGGINPTQEKFETTNKTLTQERIKEIYNTLWAESINAWNKGEGHFYWTYKLNIDTVNDPAWVGWDSWDLSRSLAKKWVQI